MSSTEPNQIPPYAVAANRIAVATDTDILFYNSGISWDQNNSMVDLCGGRRRRKNVLLILISNGGDPHAAYRMARCLQNYYERFTVLLPGFCKSAGTLVAIGAHEVVMSDSGEIGPLDIQMYKSDELFERSSGLTIMEALNTLKAKAFSMFKDQMLALKNDSGGLLTFRTASETAAELTAALFKPLFEQIDPMKVGEIARALKVAEEYGTRLDAKSRNLKPGALDQLLASFPSHSFVIDYDEARDLFHSIRKPTPNESELIRHINRAVTRGQADNSIIQFISEEPAVPSEQSNEHTQNGRTDPEGEGTPASEVVGAAGAAKAENNGAVVAGTSHGER